MSGLTIRQGAAPLGGGVHNRGDLTIDGCTIEGNAAAMSAHGATDIGRGGGIYNTGRLTLIRSTVSGNRAEYYGGALYNDGTAAAADGRDHAPPPWRTTWPARCRTSTWLRSRTKGSRSATIAGSALTMNSGDEVRFENQTGQPHTMTRARPAGRRHLRAGDSIEVP